MGAHNTTPCASKTMLRRRYKRREKIIMVHGAWKRMKGHFKVCTVKHRGWMVFFKHPFPASR
jgi:hypothetical protein